MGNGSALALNWRMHMALSLRPDSLHNFFSCGVCMDCIVGARSHPWEVTSSTFGLTSHAIIIGVFSSSSLWSTLSCSVTSSLEHGRFDNLINGWTLTMRLVDVVQPEILLLLQLEQLHLHLFLFGFIHVDHVSIPLSWPLRLVLEDILRHSLIASETTLSCRLDVVIGLKHRWLLMRHWVLGNLLVIFGRRILEVLFYKFFVIILFFGFIRFTGIRNQFLEDVHFDIKTGATCR